MTTAAKTLDRRITLQRAQVVRNEFNEHVEAWEDLATVFANRRDASAGESYRAQEVGAQITTTFTIRYSSTVADLNPRDRIIYAGVVHEITGVRETERNRWLEVSCVAKPAIQAEIIGS